MTVSQSPPPLLLRMQTLMRELLARDTGQPVERVSRDFDRDLFMTPEQAKEYGIIDAILTDEVEIGK